MGREGDREIKNLLVKNAPACAEASVGKDFGIKSKEKIQFGVMSLEFGKKKAKGGRQEAVISDQ